METSTRIIDYHLKKRIERQNLKIKLSGSNLAEWGYHLSTLLSKTSILTPKNLKISNDNKHFYLP
jgi:hypothetical protein